MFFSIILAFPLTHFLLNIYVLYGNKATLKIFGVDDKRINQLAMPSIIFLSMFFFALLIAIYLNIEKKFVANTIFVGIMITAYMVITFFRLT